MNTATPTSINSLTPKDAVLLYYALLASGGGVVELRAFMPTKWGRVEIRAGYYDDADRFAANAIAATNERASGVFATVNPPDPALLARSANRLAKVGKGGATKNEEVVGRRFLVIDLDPVRPTGISASNGEKTKAVEAARQVYQYLCSRGWPEPVVIDSGNGTHLYYPVELPADDGGLVVGALRALDVRFSDDAVHVDKAVANAARIMKVPGTWARKGDDTPERPHRCARFLTVPAWATAGQEHRPTVSEEQLRALAALAAPVEPAAPSRSKRAATPGPAWDPDDVRSALEAVAQQGRLPRPDWIRLAASALAACGGDAELAERLLVETVGEEEEGEYGPVLASAWDSITAGTLAFMAREAGWAGPTAKAPHERQAPKPKGSPAPPPPSGPIGVCVADVEPEAVRWMWPGRLAAGKVHLLDGNPGTGKSTIYSSLAACVTAGAPWPGGRPVPTAARGGVVIVTAEDDVGTTIRPRLEAAEADIDRVSVVATIPTPNGAGRLPVLPDDVSLLLGECGRVGAKLLVIDPVTAYLGDVNSHRDSDVRGALAPLAEAAEAAGVAVLLVRHLNKSLGGPALYRGGGSIAFSGLARVVLLVGKPPDEAAEHHALAVAKNNLSKFAPTLGYHIESAGPYNVGRVVWDGAVPLSANDLVRPSGTGPAAPAREEAKAFLEDALAGGPRLARELYDEAGAEGISKKTLLRAKEELGVKVERQGFGGKGAWSWLLSGAKAVTGGGDGAPRSADLVKPAQEGPANGGPPPHAGDASDVASNGPRSIDLDDDEAFDALWEKMCPF